MVPDTETIDALLSFASAVRADRRANPGTGGDGTATELLLAPRMQALIERLLSLHAPAAPQLLPEYRRAGIGRPDLAFKRAGQPAAAFIELKQPATSLSPTQLRGHDKDQFRRFRELPLWGFCNFHTLHLYRRDEIQAQAVIVPAAALDPGTPDATADRLVRRTDPAPLLDILQTFALAQPEAPRDAAEVAMALAQAARLVRQVVIDQCQAGAPAQLDVVRAIFRETLFAHPAAGGYSVTDETALFGNAFAQTLAFGLLLARETSGADVDRDAYRQLPESTYALLRATLRALTQDEILDTLGVGFEVLMGVVNVIDPALLRPRAGRDPILYFYEDFLEVFDPDARRRHGVFFTPVPVVRFMVAATERALRSALGTDGLLDRNVLILDPACGTGTFLIAAMAQAADRVRDTLGEGALPAEIAALAARLHGFELLVGPYTVAHYRMLREVAAMAGAVPAGRLPIWLADTLAPPAGALGVAPRLGFLDQRIVEERQGADRLKREVPILAIFGNPPYRRLAEGEEQGIVSGWTDGFWDDLKAPVRNAGWGGELNTFPELSVAFWRWCLWKLFEADQAPGRGVLCLITNRTFLAGHPYAGLRRMLRRRFDEITIIDLRGDSRGARPAGIAADENVFQIQVGVCITIAVARGGERAEGAEARIRYADVWQHAAFAAREKQALLERAISDTSALSFVEISRPELEDFVPRGFEGRDWPSINECFAYRGYGVKTQHDSIAYDFSPESLLAKLEIFRSEPDATRAREMFKDSRKNKSETARLLPLDTSVIRSVSFRPFDLRTLYRHRAFVDEMANRPAEAWGADNVCLYAMPTGTGAGPAVWIHGLLPDYHGFRGSYGGYAFPLWDRRHGPAAHNLNPTLLGGLSVLYARPVEAEEAFDAIAALLSATSYTHRFAWDLEECFPHVPFPRDVENFERASRIGAALRRIATYAENAPEPHRRARLAGRATGLLLEVRPIGDSFLADGSGNGFIPLQSDQSLRVANVSQRAWEFQVSGYRVLHRWLAARAGEALDATLQRAILDLVWRIEAFIACCDQADAVLVDALTRPATRTTLGLLAPGVEAEAEVSSEDDEESESPA
jgi:hypothetical protein